MGARWWLGPDGGAAYLTACWRTRGSLLVLFLGLALLFVEQGREILLMLADDPRALEAEGKSIWLRRAGFFGATFFWAAGTWYWAHFVLRFKNPWAAADAEPSGTVRILVPRVVGASVFLGMAGALGCAAFWGTQDLHNSPEWTLIELAAVCVICAIASYALGRFWPRLATPSVRPLERFRQVGRSAWIVLLGYGLGSIVLLGVAVAAPEAITDTINSLVIFIVATSLWLPVASLAAYAAMMWRVPLYLIFVLWIGGTSFFNDAHDVRRVREDPTPSSSSAVFDRQNASTAFDRWSRQNAPVSADLVRPVVFVATAGGGLRAALWTVSVLGEIEAAAPGGWDKIFAISGVSGGAVGATIYTTVQFASSLSPDLTCASDAWYCAQQAMQEDFLAPSTLALVFPDVLRMLLPLRWPELPDRAAALEKAWEVKWAQVMLGPDARANDRRNRLANSFMSIWPPGRSWPVLLLNSTSVETGKRVIISNVLIDGAFSQRQEAFVEPPVFPDSFDGLRILGRDIPASAAANLASRFPYVEPAARFAFDCRRLVPTGPDFFSDAPERLVEGCRGKGGKITWGRVVDGGYFENFGAATLSDLLRHLKPDLAKEGAFLPIVIQISSDPDIDLIDGALVDWRRPSQFVHQTVAPPLALANTRTARGILALTELKRTSREVDGAFLHFRLCRVKKNRTPPLGWYMSIKAFRVLFDARQNCQNQTQIHVLKLCLQARTRADAKECIRLASEIPGNR